MSDETVKAASEIADCLDFAYATDRADWDDIRDAAKMLRQQAAAIEQLRAEVERLGEGCGAVSLAAE